MPHDHHHHHHIDPDTGDARITWAVLVNVGLTVAQIVGAIFSGSLALFADALHNLSDAISLFIAFWARRISRRPADDKMTFGYARAEVVAALINYTSLILIGLWLAFEAIQRFFDPQPIEGWTVVILAGIALIVDAVTAALTFAMAKESVNIRAAFAHNLADALGSVAVIVAGVAILVWGWAWVDPAVTLMIATYVLWLAFAEIGDVIRILMLGAPSHIVLSDVLTTVSKIDGVEDIHSAHLWQVLEQSTAFHAHIVLSPTAWGKAAETKRSIKSALHDTHGIETVLLEMETTPDVCHAAPLIGGNKPDHRH